MALKKRSSVEQKRLSLATVEKLVIKSDRFCRVRSNNARLGSKTASQGKCRIQIATTKSRCGHDSELRIWENLYLELD